MRKIVNPFIVTGKIDPAYFCDREEESARLIRSLDNGNNLVIISPRRMGKTGLIQFCYEKPEWKKTYYTFFIDILHTSSLREFTYTLGKEIYETLLPRSKRMTQLFMQTLKSISGKFGFDPLSNTPTFSLELGDIDRPEYTLDEIFVYLAKADKPCIIAIDEFQQIAKYPEKNIEALLRTHIQKINNCHFIFAQEWTYVEVLVCGWCVQLFGHHPDLQEFYRFSVTAVHFAVVDAGAGAHGLYISRSDDAAVLMIVPMFQFPFQGNGDDFHIFMRMCAEALSRSHTVVVQYT